MVPMTTTLLLSVDVDRGNDSSIAERVLALSIVQELSAGNSYQVLVYDLRADGTVSSTALMATVDISPSVSPTTGKELEVWWAQYYSVPGYLTLFLGSSPGRKLGNEAVYVHMHNSEQKWM